MTSFLTALLAWLLAPIGFMVLIGMMITLETKGDPLITQRVLEDSMRELDLRMETQPWGLVYFTVGKRTGPWVLLYVLLGLLGWPFWIFAQLASVRSALDRYK